MSSRGSREGKIRMEIFNWTSLANRNIPIRVVRDSKKLNEEPLYDC
jgi:hypothetical protein